MKSKLGHSLFVSIVILSSTQLGAAEKERAWQQGKLADMSSQHYVTHGGSTTTGHVDDYGNINTSTSSSSWGHLRCSYTVDTGKYLVTGSEVLSWRWSKEARVIVKDTVDYAIEKRDLFIRDLDGKVHKLHIDRQELKEPPK